jgi:hypothetical protein
VRQTSYRIGRKKIPIGGYFFAFLLSLLKSGLYEIKK